MHIIYFITNSLLATLAQLVTERVLRSSSLCNFLHRAITYTQTFPSPQGFQIPRVFFFCAQNETLLIVHARTPTFWLTN